MQVVLVELAQKKKAVFKAGHLRFFIEEVFFNHRHTHTHTHTHGGTTYPPSLGDFALAGGGSEEGLPPASELFLLPVSEFRRFRLRSDGGFDDERRLADGLAYRIGDEILRVGN